MGNASVTVGDIRNENVNDWFSLNLTNGLNKTQIMSSLIKGTWKKEIQKRDIRKEKKGKKTVTINHTCLKCLKHETKQVKLLFSTC